MTGGGGLGAALGFWSVAATGKPPTVLLREGWTWGEVFQAAAIALVRAEAESEAAGSP